MVLRALLLLTLALGASLLATLRFGDEVLVALGLVLAQAKLLWKKALAVDAGAITAWLKHHGGLFVTKDLPYRFLSTVALPLMVGRRVLRRLTALTGRLLAPVSRTHARLRAWYDGQTGPARLLLAVTLLTATVALTVTGIGLWLVLFSVSVPLWVAALGITLGRTILATAQKTLFRMLALLQLRWIARGATRLIPEQALARHRRLRFRLIRAAIRRRRLTARTLARRADRLPFRAGLALELMTARLRGDR